MASRFNDRPQFYERSEKSPVLATTSPVPHNWQPHAGIKMPCSAEKQESLQGFDLSSFSGAKSKTRAGITCLDVQLVKKSLFPRI
jgi:hypothetical protein